jgi:hypothetical protein
MRNHKFRVGDLVIVNEQAKNGLPGLVGKVGIINEILLDTYDYAVGFNGTDSTKLKESELERKYYHHNQKVKYLPIDEEGIIKHLDYANCQAELEFKDRSYQVVNLLQIEEIKESVTLEDISMGKFQKLANDIGAFTDMKNQQYGSSVDATYKMIQVLMERYTYDENQYLIPKELLQHLLLTVRVMDKQNRIFNNPSGKGDSESPWKDVTGYGLIGIDMVEGKNTTVKNPMAQEIINKLNNVKNQ